MTATEWKAGDVIGHPENIEAAVMLVERLGNGGWQVLTLGGVLFEIERWVTLRPWASPEIAERTRRNARRAGFEFSERAGSWAWRKDGMAYGAPQPSEGSPEPIGHGMVEDFGVDTGECPECGVWMNTRDHAERGHCFTCWFWLQKLVEPGRWVRCETSRGREHYSIRTVGWTTSTVGKGFGGRRCTVHFFDGQTVKTDDLWHQGIIPERFHDRFPANATIDWSGK